MAQLITIEIDQETCETTIDLQGFHGKGCEAVLKAFEMSDAGQVANKPEFNQVQRQTVKAR